MASLCAMSIGPKRHSGEASSVTARRRRRALGALAAAALLLHAALLSGADWTWPAPLRVAVFQVRMLGDAPAPGPDHDSNPAVPRVVAEMPVAPAPSPPVPVHAAARAPPARRATPPTAPPPARATAPSAPARATDDGPREAPPVGSGADGAATPDNGATPEPTLPAVASAPGLSTDESIPLYRTRIPPAAILRYALRRGSAPPGTAELRWRPTAEGYALRFEGSIGGSVILAQASDGGFDVAGLAPARYTDRSPRRALLATNFRREVGRISFSGSSSAYALARGTQDRLSWLIQLAAVAAAEPDRLAPGGTIAIAVVGVRGEPETWLLRSMGLEDVSTDSGPITAVKLIRESRGLYDTGVEVWLDPGRHFLPVRVVLRSGAESPTLELGLQQLEFES